LEREKENNKKENVRIVPRFNQGMRNKESKILSNDTNQQGTEEESKAKKYILKVKDNRRKSVFTEQLLPVNGAFRTWLKRWKTKRLLRNFNNLTDEQLNFIGDTSYMIKHKEEKVDCSIA
jgi:hypothetical protein